MAYTGIEFTTLVLLEPSFNKLSWGKAHRRILQIYWNVLKMFPKLLLFCHSEPVPPVAAPSGWLEQLKSRCCFRQNLAWEYSVSYESLIFLNFPQMWDFKQPAHSIGRKITEGSSQALAVSWEDWLVSSEPWILLLLSTNWSRKMQKACWSVLFVVAIADINWLNL